MGLFGFGGVSHSMEEQAVRYGMERIGAYRGTHMENCERCDYFLTSEQTKSKYFGGCSRYQIKVFANHVCADFQR